MDQIDNLELGVLAMQRFNGIEKYKLNSATWNLYRDEGKMTLCLRIDSNEAIEPAEDTASFFRSLNWELNLVDEKLTDGDLVSGFSATIPEAYDESKDGWITNFYYASHEGSENNRIEILEREGDKLLIKLEGEINDVNYYDGSKPNSQLVVQAWFDRNKTTMRSLN